MATSTPTGRKVLISYAHENEEHRRRVARLAELTVHGEGSFAE